jgi:ActR/RegA family two-component response regulator
MLKESLMRQGFEVVSSEDEEEAIDISFLWPPTLAIVDRHIGGKSTGHLLVERLRRFLGEPDLSAFYPSVSSVDRVNAAPLVLLQAY